MTIQQVASGNSSTIMSFLFQDDGSTEGTVLEGAEFARTLHQLLGEYQDDGDESIDANAPLSEELAKVITDTEAELKSLTAPLTESLEGLIKDFKLPEHGATLPAEAGFEGAGDGQEVEQPFWGIAPFTDVMTALREHTASLHSSVTEHHARNTEAEGKAIDSAIELAAHEAVLPDTQAGTPTAPVFASGIAHVIALARDVAQASAELTQRPDPKAALQSGAGRTAPLGGKGLPQGLRSVPTAVGQPAANGANTKTAIQGAALTDSSMLMPEAEATVSNAFFAELLNVHADTPAPQAATPQSQALTHGIQGLRAESPVAILPKSAHAEAAPGNPMPQLYSPHLAGSDAWFQDLGARVDWLKDMKLEKAELQLHPAELGLLEIQISAGDDATTVSFVTHNAEARQLIEDSMPRLRELLAHQGMQLGQSHVSQHSAGQRRDQDPHSGPGSPQRDSSAPDEPAPARRRAYVADPNRIDHYV